MLYQLLLWNYIITFDNENDNRLQIFLFFQEQDCLTAVQRGLQEVVEVFSFLFSGKGDDKGASFIIFFLTT